MDGDSSTPGGDELDTDSFELQDFASPQAPAAPAVWAAGGAGSDFAWNEGQSPNDDGESPPPLASEWLEAAGASPPDASSTIPWDSIEPTLPQQGNGAGETAGASRAAAQFGGAAPPRVGPPAVKRARGAQQLAVPAADGPSAVGTDIAQEAYGRLSFQRAEQLLRNDSFGCAGTRPDYLAVLGWNVLGNVYKDQVERRRSGIDRWQCKYGKGSATEATADGKYVVRRSHGKVKVIQRAGEAEAADEGRAAAEERPLPALLKFHQYTLESVAVGGSGSGQQARALVTPVKLFHLLGMQEQDEQATASGAADPPGAAGQFVTTGAVKHESAASRETHSFSGMLQLSNPQQQERIGGRDRRSRPTWVTFHRGGLKGEQRGSIVDGEHGAQFSSTSGDFAEFHRRCPEELPFAEGDVVGLNRCD